MSGFQSYKRARMHTKDHTSVLNLKRVNFVVQRIILLVLLVIAPLDNS